MCRDKNTNGFVVVESIAVSIKQRTFVSKLVVEASEMKLDLMLRRSERRHVIVLAHQCTLDSLAYLFNSIAMTYKRNSNFVLMKTLIQLSEGYLTRECNRASLDLRFSSHSFVNYFKSITSTEAGLR